MASLSTRPPRLLNIAVLDRHIAAGLPMDACYCPIALATIEELSAAGIDLDHEQIAVDNDCIEIVTGSTVVKYTLPTEADRFISSFDHDDLVHPITFTAKRVFLATN